MSLEAAWSRVQKRGQMKGRGINPHKSPTASYPFFKIASWAPVYLHKASARCILPTSLPIPSLHIVCMPKLPLKKKALYKIT